MKSIQKVLLCVVAVTSFSHCHSLPFKPPTSECRAPTKEELSKRFIASYRVAQRLCDRSVNEWRALVSEGQFEYILHFSAQGVDLEHERSVTVYIERGARDGIVVGKWRSASDPSGQVHSVTKALSAAQIRQIDQCFAHNERFRFWFPEDFPAFRASPLIQERDPTGDKYVFTDYYWQIMAYSPVGESGIAIYCPLGLTESTIDREWSNGATFALEDGARCGKMVLALPDEPVFLSELDKFGSPCLYTIP